MSGTFNNVHLYSVMFLSTSLLDLVSVLIPKQTSPSIINDCKGDLIVHAVNVHTCIPEAEAFIECK